jgi:hypothetical protein
MKLRSIFTGLFFCLILISCEKNRQITTENTDIPLITKILIDGVSHQEYTYNEANLPGEEKSKLFYTRHIYNDNNQLVKSEYYMDEAMFSSSGYVVEAAMSRTEWASPENTTLSLTRAYEYNDVGQVIRITYIRPSVTNSEYSDYTWDNDRITRQTMYWNGATAGYIDYLYDERGNLSRETKYMSFTGGDIVLTAATDYLYDNMHNPYGSFKRLMTPGIYTNPNNITRETYTLHYVISQGTEQVQVKENTYEYNRLGYPVKVNGEAEYVYR